MFAERLQTGIEIDLPVVATSHKQQAAGDHRKEKEEERHKTCLVSTLNSSLFYFVCYVNKNRY